jgi:pimeloyl-ACP methyl ester carboxylesterase
MPIPPIVLVHGAWAGAWCWRRALAPLRAAGHEVHAVTLTGVGERSHLMSAQITLATHIADVLNLIESEELREVVLVGHSYGGMVVTGAADVLLARAPDADERPWLNRLVYVDAVVPLPGESWSSTHSGAVIAARSAASRPSGGISMPAPDPALFGLEGADAEWVRRRQTPHPFRLYHEPLPFDAARVASVPRCFIDCTSPALATVAAFRPRVRAEPGWKVVELATGHDPMVSLPERFVEVLLEAIAA